MRAGLYPMSHHAALLLAHSVACLLGAACARMRPGLWPGCPPPVFARPWRELGSAALAAVAIVGLGQLYANGCRLPADGDGPRAVLAETANQLAIFSPVWVLRGRDVAWLFPVHWLERAEGSLEPGFLRCLRHST